MRCPKPCWTPMDRDGERHVCPVCRTVITLHDPAYIPAPGYTPSPLRVPAPEIFKSLESELGWSQEEATLDMSHANADGLTVKSFRSAVSGKVPARRVA